MPSAFTPNASWIFVPSIVIVVFSLISIVPNSYVESETRSFILISHIVLIGSGRVNTKSFESGFRYLNDSSIYILVISSDQPNVIGVSFQLSCEELLRLRALLSISVKDNNKSI